jgi:hypothetical protein
MQGVADPAPEDRSESDEVSAKLRKCSGKRSEEWKFLEDIGGTRELGGSASCFDGFKEIMELYLQRAKCEAYARDPDAHLTLDTVVCLGLHVDEEANQYVSVLSTPSLWLNPARALQHGIVRELYGDARILVHGVAAIVCLCNPSYQPDSGVPFSPAPLIQTQVFALFATLSSTLRSFRTSSSTTKLFVAS